MKRTLRFLAALLALLGLTTALVEQAWAACPEMGAAPVGVEAGSDHRHPGHVPAEDSDTSRPDATPCPMAAATGMACGASVAPGVSAATPLGSEVQVRVLVPADEAPTFPQLSSLFRPPRR